ncbi:MAG: ATP-binding protein, partial [Pseudomonadota bacterium]|nr:ATP-binding protein [Pseudomonadota bacterium]
ACKWAQSRVAVRARPLAANDGRTGLVLEVEDDGPGIAADRRRAILQRGVRADPAVAGHGIGLAVVRDIVEEAYGGRLEIGSSGLGGARVQVEIGF